MRHLVETKLLTISLVVLVFVLSGCGSSSGGSSAGETPFEFEGRAEVAAQPLFADRLWQDMNQPHAAPPSGIPLDWDWAAGPRINMGNQPGDFSAFISWGQVYLAAGSAPQPNLRIQIRNLNAYVLNRADGAWYRLKSSPQVDGAHYREDFVGDSNRPADPRVESDGGISVAIPAGYNFHFWPAEGERSNVDPTRIAGVITTVEARLVLDDPSGPDGRDNSFYMMSAGADYWLDKQAVWDNWETNNDVAIGRFSRINHQWQLFTMSTVTEQQLLAPLPVPSLPLD